MKEVSVMKLRISPDMDFYLDMDLQGVTERTRDYDVQQYEKVVYEEFLNRIKKAFPEGDFRIYTFEFNLARETARKAA
jgi:thymidylate kinase